MLSKRIIACLDIREGRTVKGINFESIRDAGDPVELAKLYATSGIDELVFLDITATVEKRKIFVDLVDRIATEINIPFTVGGGINSKHDVSALLKAGADKVSVNSAAVRNPELITELSDLYGSQCIVVAVDTKLTAQGWKVYLDGGRTETELLTLDWVKKVEAAGAGEILLTSMNNDGTKDGFALDITSSVSQAVSIPVIASGGAGSKEHFLKIFNEGKADAALAASIFHFGEVNVLDLKRYLKLHQIEVRI